MTFLGVIVSVVIAVVITWGWIYFGGKNNTTNRNSVKNNVKQSINYKDAFNQNKLDDVIDNAEKDLQQNADDKDLLTILATAYAQKGSLQFKENEYGQKSLEIANKLIGLDVNDQRAYYLKGYAYEIMQNYKQALENYNKANSIKETAMVTNQIGHVYDLQGNNINAEKFYKKALEINKNFAKAKINLARDDFDNKKYKEAKATFLEIYKNLENNREKSDIAYMLGQIYTVGEFKDLTEAEKYMVQATEFDKENSMAWVGLGQVAILRGIEDEKSDYTVEMTRALDCFEQAIRIYPNQTLAYLFEANLLLTNNDKENATKAYFNALRAVDRDITLMNDQKENLKIKIKKEIALYKINLPEKQEKETSMIDNKLKNSLFRVNNALAAGPTYNSDGYYDIPQKTINGVTYSARHFRSKKTLEDFLIDALGSKNGTKGHKIVWFSTYTICNNNVYAEWGNVCTGTRPIGSHVCSGSDSGLSVDTAWHKTDDCSTAGKCAYYYQCTGGNPPFGANWCAGDNTGLTSDVTWRQVFPCTSARKCEFTVPAGCGPADNGEYVSTAKLRTFSTCPSGATETNFVDNSGLASGAGWTWNCTKANYATSSCSAKKKGECEVSANGPFNSLSDACKYGAFHSVYLDGSGILRWTCGSGDSSPGSPIYHIGSFETNNAAFGVSVPHDHTPMSTSCFCKPSYVYSCVDGGYTKDCSKHCGETNSLIRTPVKTDTDCFPNEHLSVTEAEYNCPDQSVQCPPCGVNAGESGTINEAN
jgi:tetratricopeptide (TPR) repeat protein